MAFIGTESGTKEKSVDKITFTCLHEDTKVLFAIGLQQNVD